MRKTIATILLVQQALWLLVVAPGHTRGQVTLPGSQISERSCCSKRSEESNQHERDENRVAHCAICSIATHLFTAPPPDLTPAPSDESVPAPVQPDFVSRTIPFVHTYNGRGPPTA